jgi:hypothetical protein
LPLKIAVESMAVYMMSDGSEYPWRAKMRGPSFVNLQILPEVLRGHKMSDVVAIIGSTDVIQRHYRELERQSYSQLFYTIWHTAQILIHQRRGKPTSQGRF